MKKEKGQLIVLSGPSGVGKSTVIAELLGQRDNIYFSVSYRIPRKESAMDRTKVITISTTGLTFLFLRK